MLFRSAARMRTSSPVTSQYFFAGWSEGGASTDESVGTSAVSGLRTQRRTGSRRAGDQLGEVDALGSAIDVHRVRPGGPRGLVELALVLGELVDALALLGEDLLERLVAPVDVLAVLGVLERSRHVRVRVLLRERRRLGRATVDSLLERGPVSSRGVLDWPYGHGGRDLHAERAKLRWRSEMKTVTSAAAGFTSYRRLELIAFKWAAQTLFRQPRSCPGRSWTSSSRPRSSSRAPKQCASPSSSRLRGTAD